MDPIPERQVWGYELHRRVSHSVVELTLSHAEEVHNVAVKSFPDPWSVRDYAFFLAHDCRWAWGIESTAGKLDAYMIGLLVREDLDIISIATAPEARRCGMASSLLDSVLENKRIECVTLEVNKENRVAVELYKKMGFSVTGLRPKYYSQTYDALTMRFKR